MHTLVTGNKAHTNILQASEFRSYLSISVVSNGIRIVQCCLIQNVCNKKLVTKCVNYLFSGNRICNALIFSKIRLPNYGVNVLISHYKTIEKD